MITLLILVNVVLILSCFFLALKAFSKHKRKVLGIFICSIFVVFMFFVIYPFFTPMCSTSCEALLQLEANIVAGVIADYFAIPKHTKLPTIEDLIAMGYVPPDKRKSPIKSYSVKESDLVVFIMGELQKEIEIWVIARKNECNAGKAWVYYMFRKEGEWID